MVIVNAKKVKTAAVNTPILPVGSWSRKFAARKSSDREGSCHAAAAAATTISMAAPVTCLFSHLDVVS
jgi:hypothetical protein